MELTNLVSTGTTAKGTQEQKISQQSLKKNFIYCLLKFCYTNFIDNIINIYKTVVEVITYKIPKVSREIEEFMKPLKQKIACRDYKSS